MLLSHRYQFIFIKTRKTAGTSIEVDLAPLLGADDVVTPVFPPVAGHLPRNYRSPNPLRRMLGQVYHNHAPARLVRRLAGKALWERYFTFCVEREPVAKCQSMWRMAAFDPLYAHYQPGLSWDEYVERGRFPVDSALILDGRGRLLVDRILAYEQLDAELGEVAAQLGIPFAGLRARAKSGLGARGEGQAAPAVSPAQRQRIYDAFAPTLPFTGYGEAAR